VAASVTAADGDEEGIPNVLKEAMASGMPVVGTRHAGIPELIEDGVSGLLVPERNQAALADALQRLALQPEQWAAMGRAGRAKIEMEYDIHRLNDRLAGLLENLIRPEARSR
jgi:colanic acid/amylovoran biosynthesis glycosyltransferase